MVMDHTLKRGKVKGRDPLKNERMETMLKEFREDIKEYGAGDQLVCVCVCVCVFVRVGACASVVCLFALGWIDHFVFCFGVTARSQKSSSRSGEQFILVLISFAQIYCHPFFVQTGKCLGISQ